MFVNRLFISFCLAGALLVPPVSALAVTAAVHDVHKLQETDEFQQTIEKRCAICHTRDRVDTAIDQGAELEELMQRMIERGAILNERDKRVLGTFWGSPMKNEGDEPPLPSGK